MNDRLSLIVEDVLALNDEDFFYLVRLLDYIGRNRYYLGEDNQQSAD